MKLLKTFLSLTLILTSLILAQDPEALLQTAETQMASGDFEGAEASLKQSLGVDPSFAPAHIGLSKLALHKGDLKKANEHSNTAVQMDEDFRDWSKQLDGIRIGIQNGTQAVERGQFPEAVNEFEKILGNFPYFSEAYFYIGLTKFRAKDMDGAASNWGKALELYPNHRKARKGLNNITKQYLNNGNKAYKTGNLDKALTYYHQALKYDDSFYLAYFQIGVIEKKQGNSDRAIENFLKVLELKPEYAKAWFTLGVAYEVDNKLSEATNAYLKAIEINVGYTKAYGNLAKIYTDDEKYDQALDLLKTAIQIDPDYADGYMRMGLVHAKQGNSEDAISNLEIATSLNERNYNLWFTLAEQYNLAGKWDDAINAALKCKDLKKSFGGSWYEMGVGEMGKKNRMRAKKYFEEARKDRNWRKLAERKIDEINNPAKYQK
ncbi:MAG: tetratricopeptide repeat protein [Candidatus Marinimicrobia bacterium]|nr:tetratricopeptide repeat protein [Candidatus Neomarinimicrobiota bacterium]